MSGQHHVCQLLGVVLYAFLTHTSKSKPLGGPAHSASKISLRSNHLSSTAIPLAQTNPMSHLDSGSSLLTGIAPTPDPSNSFSLVPWELSFRNVNEQCHHCLSKNLSKASYHTQVNLYPLPSSPRPPAIWTCLHHPPVLSFFSLCSSLTGLPYCFMTIKPALTC